MDNEDEGARMMGWGRMTTRIDASSSIEGGERRARGDHDVRARGRASNEADGADARERWTKRTRDDDADGAAKL
jgi:hypothetical protein